MTHLIAYLAAFIGSVSFGLASVFEQKGTFSTGSLSGFNLRNFVSLAGNWYYAAGLALDGLGFVMTAVALRALPLFFVQSVETASIVVTVIGSKLLIGKATSRRDYIYIGVVLVGLTILCLVAGAEAAASISTLLNRSLLIGSIATALIAVALSKPLASRPKLTAIMSGICFSMVAVLMRVIPVHGSLLHVILNPLCAALVLNGVVGLMLFSIALQQGSVTVIYSLTFVVETIVPTIIGVTLLHDVPLHHRWVLMSLGLAVTIAGSSALAAAKKGRALE